MNELVAAVPWLGKRNPAAARWLIIIALAVGAPSSPGSSAAAGCASSTSRCST
jgi:hypothetical protein